MKEKRQFRKQLFNELMQRIGYVSREDLAEELAEQFGLSLSGTQISSRLRADRKTVFTEAEFLAIVDIFTCHFSSKMRLTAFEALLFWEWSDELRRETLLKLRRIWARANHLAEFEAAYRLYTQWDIFTEPINWFDPPTRKLIKTKLRNQAYQGAIATQTRPTLENNSLQISDVFDEMRELQAIKNNKRLVEVYRQWQPQLYDYATAEQAAPYVDILIDVARYLLEIGNITLAHDALEDMTDLAFASDHIAQDQRNHIQTFEESSHEVLKARALLYQSYWLLEDTHTLSTGLQYAEEAYQYYKSAEHRYGQADTLNRMSLYFRKMGNFHESILHLSYAKDVASYIKSPKDRFDWLTMIRSAEAFTAFQFVQDKREPYTRFLSVGSQFPSKYAQIDYRFALATMTYQLGDAKSAQTYGQAAEHEAHHLNIKYPLSESHQQWRKIAVASGWHLTG